MSYFMKIHPFGFELFHADGQVDNEANNRLRNFVNVPKNAVYIYNVTNLNYIHATGSQIIAYQLKCIFNMLLNLSKI